MACCCEAGDAVVIDPCEAELSVEELVGELITFSVCETLSTNAATAAGFPTDTRFWRAPFG